MSQSSQRSNVVEDVLLPAAVDTGTGVVALAIFTAGGADDFAGADATRLGEHAVFGFRRVMIVSPARFAVTTKCCG